MSSDGGALLLREADKVLDLAGRLGACFEDHRDPTRNRALGRSAGQATGVGAHAGLR